MKTKTKTITVEDLINGVNPFNRTQEEIIADVIEDRAQAATCFLEDTYVGEVVKQMGWHWVEGSNVNVQRRHNNPNHLFVGIRVGAAPNETSFYDDEDSKFAAFLSHNEEVCLAEFDDLNVAENQALLIKAVDQAINDSLDNVFSKLENFIFNLDAFCPEMGLYAKVDW